MKRLFLRGDDMGSCRSANEAIAETCRFGLLKNVSVMACGPHFEEAAQLLKELPDVCVGLHVVLNAEWDGPKWGPVMGAAAVASLVDEKGYFLPTPTRLNERGFSLDEAEAEANAQLERMKNAGLRPVYLDEHMGVGWLPGLRDRLHALANREGLLLVNSGYQRVPPATQPAATLAEDWITRLESVPDDGDYLIVTHPGKDAPDMQAFLHAGLEPGSVARERDAERQSLTDPAFADSLTRLGIQTHRFDD